MWQMSTTPSSYIGYVDGGSHSTRNIVSVDLVIFSPIGNLVGSRGIFQGPTTNNVAEYSVVIKLLSRVASLGILHPVAQLDS